MKLFFLPLTLILMANYCQAQHPHPVFGEFAAIIKKAKTITVHEIDKTDTNEEEEVQDTSKRTFLGYAIARSQSLESKALHDLSKTLLNEKNYIFDAKKSCPMMATYALEIINKDNQSFSILLSDSFCTKAVIHSSEKGFETKYIDLTDENEILTLLDGLLNP